MKKIYTFCIALLSISGISFAQNIIPASDELVLPQYAYFGGDVANRMPVVCRLKLTGLLPGGLYRYFVGMSSNPSATTQTPGNMYRINNGQSLAGFGNITGFTVTKAINSSEINNDEMNTTNASRHGRFSADANGNYTGWFACVPVGNATQQASGSDVYFYVQLNDGVTGTTLAQSFRTTSTIKLLDYSSTPGDAAGCTGLLGTSDVGDEKMVAIYDNTAATGRPLYCTFTENNNNGGVLNEGTIWTNPMLYPTVDGVSGSWAAIIPNTLSGGVKAINFLNIQDGSLVTLSNAPATNTSADGAWNGVATTNPTGGSTTPVTINSIAGSALPVNLLSFSGQSAKEGVKLYWKTSQEINNHFFEIMRSSGDGLFQPIGRVNAATTPALTNQYQFVDPHPKAGRNFYQLRQVDIDGTAKLHHTIMVNVGLKDNGMRLVSSGSSEVVVAIQSTENSRGQLTYTDLQGRVLYSQSTNLREGENMIRIPVAGFPRQLGVINYTSATSERMQLKIMR